MVVKKKTPKGGLQEGPSLFGSSVAQWRSGCFAAKSQSRSRTQSQGFVCVLWWDMVLKKKCSVRLLFGRVQQAVGGGVSRQNEFSGDAGSGTVQVAMGLAASKRCKELCLSVVLRL